jgi:NADH-quinone oxidoreductase subunit H
MEATVLKAGFDFTGIYGFFDDLLPESLDWLAYVIAAVILGAVLLNAIIISTALYTWFERRVLGRFQSRMGPNRWGPFGLFQPLADLIKLMTKEDTIPEGADRPVFTLAPIVFLVPALLVFSVLPFHSSSFIGKLNVGLIFIIAITSVNTLGVFMAGWASRNKYAMLGAMRGVAMLISYEVPMGLAVVGIALGAGTLSLSGVVLAQNIPFILVMPLGFIVFITAASAEMSRTPFDIIEADSELGAGYNTEYSGIKFALLQLNEFMAPLIVAALVTTLFLSGWRGWGPVPGPIWFVIKSFVIVLLLLWVRATWPRLRVDQIMGFAWKGLFPLAIINIFAMAVEFQVLRDDTTGALTTGDLWIMAAANWIITIVSLAVIANVLGQRKLRRPEPVPSPLANMYADRPAPESATQLSGEVD